MAAARPTMGARYIDRDVIGLPEQVVNALDNAARRGHLVSVTAPRPAPDAPGKVWVRARFLAPNPGPTASPARVRLNRRRAAVATGVVAGTAVLAGLAYLVWLAVQALLAVWPVVAGALLVLFLLWLAAGRAGVCCAGLHCPGCKH